MMMTLGSVEDGLQEWPAMIGAGAALFVVAFAGELELAIFDEVKLAPVWLA